MFTREAFTALLPEISVPSLPFLGAYALKVQSVDAAEVLLKQERLPVRRLGAALVVPFPEELGLGAWLFVEDAAQLPWRS